MRKISALLMVFFMGLSLLSATEDEGLKKVMELINVERATAGKAALVESPELMSLSWEWSYRIAKEKRMSHRKNLLELCEKYDYRFMNENLHFDLSDFDAERIVQSWMNSPAHKRNLLEEKITLMGVGFSKSQDGALFVVFNGAAKADKSE